MNVIRLTLISHLCSLTFLGNLLCGAEEHESTEAPLQLLLALGQAKRSSEPGDTIRRYRDILVADVDTVGILLDQVYRRKAKPAEITAVYKLLPGLNSDEFQTRESATMGLTELGLPIDLLLADLIDDVSQESAVRLTKVRENLIRIRGERLINLNLAAKEIFAQMSTAQLRNIARKESRRLSSDPSEAESHEDLINSVNWMSARLLGSLRSSQKESDLHLFAGAVLHASKENPVLPGI